MGFIYETSLWAFLFVTVIGGGGAAFMIGRAAAKRWKPFLDAVLYVVILAAAIRFLHWGLFAGAALASWREAQGSLFSIQFYAADAVILLLFALLGFTLKRRAQMSRQYGRLTEKALTKNENATTQP
jgi:hypothetical protein